MEFTIQSLNCLLFKSAKHQIKPVLKRLSEFDRARVLKEVLQELQEESTTKGKGEG